MRPGSTVIPPRSITLSPGCAGVALVAAMAAMRSPLTTMVCESRVLPLCTSSRWPARMRVLAAGAVACAETCRQDAEPSSATAAKQSNTSAPCERAEFQMHRKPPHRKPPHRKPPGSRFSSRQSVARGPVCEGRHPYPPHIYPLYGVKWLSFNGFNLLPFRVTRLKQGVYGAK